MPDQTHSTADPASPPNIHEMSDHAPCASQEYAAPAQYQNLDEVAAAEAAQSNSQLPQQVVSLEDTRAQDTSASAPLAKPEVSQFATQVYTHSYLVFFSILGTLARVGLTALTTYPGIPVFSTVWANFGGSFIMGFLTEDRMLFRDEWGVATYDQQIAQSKKSDDEESNGRPTVDLVAAKKAHLSTKKTIPLYIGLATGFCGSFTSFSTFIRDVFLAMSNEMHAPGVPNSPVSRNGGYSFMALLSVMMTDISLSLAGYFMGMHLAMALDGITPSLPFKLTRGVLDNAGVILGWGCWIGAVFMAIFPPHDAWRGQILFSLIFAPLGCLLRFYLSMHLNAKVASFPLGTFTANILGTAILGMAWDIAHVDDGGMIGCQVMQGLEDGLCGCLTTVSTWVAELSGLRKRHSYIYGAASVVTALVLLICIMGGLRWSDGFHPLLCKT